MGLPQIWQTLFGTGSKLVKEIIPFGTAAGTVAEGNDARITGSVQSSRKVVADAGLSGGGALTADVTLALDMGYDPVKTYRKPCTVMSSGGDLYIWKQASGPGVAGVGAKTPGAAGSEDFWERVPPKADVAQVAADVLVINAAASGAGMPSLRSLSLSNSGIFAPARYTAPADGWISVVAVILSSHVAYVRNRTKIINATICSGSGAGGAALLPVSKGDSIDIDATHITSVSAISFIYAEGAK